MILGKQKVLLGITGGIAAYKAPYLVRKLTAKGAEVRVVLTDSAKAFVSPLALQAVSGNPVSDDLLDPQAEAAMGHIELAKWADTLMIAPATANFIAKLACGLADDLLSTLCLATSAKIFVAPAMNQQMWHAQATQTNLACLQERGLVILGPESGEQACGDVGPGRMLEPEQLADAVLTAPLPQTLAGKRVVITAGPTQEKIDPVRYISNHSSGKMGYAIAEAARDLGADVILVSGPVKLTPPQGVATLQVCSALDMHRAVMEVVNNCDLFVGCAAVADYRAKQADPQKIKKQSDELTLTFIKNPDIILDVAQLPHPPFTLGFAAETQNVQQYAIDKLHRKKLNMIAANDVSQQGIGFNSEENALHVFWDSGEATLPKANKQQLAIDLLQLAAKQLNSQVTSD
jgi:phosphopantothenoylcysteine decarboxylase/phosphopantothenate--cysteine ligase